MRMQNWLTRTKQTLAIKENNIVNIFWKCFLFKSSRLTMSDDLSRQIAEIEVLCSIYGDEWKTEDEAQRSYSIKIANGEDCVILYVTLPEEYPSSSPPTFELLAPNFSEYDLSLLTTKLQEIYLEYIGEEVLYQWIEKIRETLNDLIPAKNTEDPDIDVSNISLSLPDTAGNIQQDLAQCEQWEVPIIVHGETITDRKSIFQGHAAQVVSVDQVRCVLDKLYENKRIQNATHNIYAFRIFNERTNSYLHDCEDDGETHAGGRLLHLLQIMDVKNVMVVVTRWYGGILLGPDRFRHINNAARQVLVSGNFISESKDKKRKKK